jgi:hypothetical protein
MNIETNEKCKVKRTDLENMFEQNTLIDKVIVTKDKDRKTV